MTNLPYHVVWSFTFIASGSAPDLPYAYYRNHDQQ
jgi:hypothetical protein